MAKFSSFALERSLFWETWKTRMVLANWCSAVDVWQIHPPCHYFPTIVFSYQAYKIWWKIKNEIKEALSFQPCSCLPSHFVEVWRVAKRPILVNKWLIDSRPSVDAILAVFRESMIIKFCFASWGKAVTYWSSDRVRKTSDLRFMRAKIDLSLG